MKSKPIAHYFETARQLPIAMSMDQVRLIVSTNRIPPKPTKGWSLNNFLLMSTLVTIIGTFFYLYTPSLRSEEATYQPIEINIVEKEINFEEVSFNELADASTPSLILSKNEKTEQVEIAHSSKDTSSAIPPLVPPITEVSQSIPVVAPTEISEIEEEVSEIEEVEKIEEPTLDQVFDIKGESITTNKSITVSANDLLKLSASNTPIIINTWDRNEIEVIATFTLETQNKEHTQLGLEDFKLELKREGNLINVVTNWDDIENCNCGLKRKNKVKTDNGDQIEFDQFTIGYTVKVPKSINMDLVNRYSNIVIPTINGNVKATVFKGNISTGDLNGTIDLNAKYGNLTVGNYEEGSMDVYKGAISGKNGRLLSLKAYYSSVSLEEIGELQLNSFKSSTQFSGNMMKIDGAVKYGSLAITGDVDQLELEVFKSSLKLNNSKVSKLALSYSDFKAEDIDQLEFTKAFKSNILLNNLIDLEGNFQYSPLSVKSIGKSMDISSFKGNISVGEMGKDFTKIKVMSKYDNITIRLHNKSSYALETESSYSQINLPSGLISSNNQLLEEINQHFVGVQNDNGGSNLSSVYFNLFKGNLNLK